MNDHRKRLGELAHLATKTEAAERSILSSAESRLAVVQSQIDRARVGVESAPDAAQDRYLELVRERGQLHQVIARARDALGS